MDLNCCTKRLSHVNDFYHVYAHVNSHSFLVHVAICGHLSNFAFWDETCTLKIVRKSVKEK